MVEKTKISNLAQAIFSAGIDAVRPERLITNSIRVTQSELLVCDRRFDLDSFSRLVLVGAGKASGAMAAAAIRLLRAACPSIELAGWVNVPDDCRSIADSITIHRCRPPGYNLPTQRAVEGTEQICRLIGELGARDLCICLISGGGSSLLVAPPPEVSLDDKCAVTKLLSARGASIQQLNRVRRQLSRVKGGRLVARRPKARIVALVLSDVLDDRLDLIASGPTVVSPDDTPQTALQVFRELQIKDDDIPEDVLRYLKSKPGHFGFRDNSTNHSTHLVGNLSLAVKAAAAAASNLGFATEVEIRDAPNLDADHEGKRFAEIVISRMASSTRFALISGGEPVVLLGPYPGKGGRNQQLVLAALQRLYSRSSSPERDFCLLSGGTDGEDGNTAIAGAWIDRSSWRQSQTLRTDPTPYLDRNDAFSFFSQQGGLFDTGLTETNVGDLRVLLVGDASTSGSASE